MFKVKKKNLKNDDVEVKDSKKTKQSEKEPVEENPNIVKIKKQVRTFVSTYKLAIIGFFLMLVMLGIGGSITSKERTTISKAQAAINTIDTEYQRYQRMSKDNLRAYESASLDTNRWKKDDKYVLNLINDAFTHGSPADYESHRQKYSSLAFNITDLQKDYFVGISGPVYDDKTALKKYLGDASDLIKSEITAYTSYVINVDGDTYTYVAILTVLQGTYDDKNMMLNDESRNIVLTYKCSNPTNTDINHSVDVTDMTADWIR